MKSKELRLKLAKVAADMRALYQKTEKEDRGFTADERSEWDKLEADYAALEQRVADAERVEKMESAPTDTRGAPVFDDDSEPAIDEPTHPDLVARRSKEYRSAYLAFLRDGSTELSSEHRKLLRQHQAEMEIRAQGTGDSAGGYTIPEGFAGYITERMLDFSGLLGATARPRGPALLRTASGNTIPFPTNDDTGNVGVLLAENNQVTELDTVFGARNLMAYMFTSRLIRVSLQLLQDEAVNLERYLANILGKRIGRALSPYFAVGTGTTQPTGLATAATDGGVDISTAAGITYVDLLDFEHALDPAYRSRGASWVFNDTTLRAIKGLVDGNLRPLWIPADAAGLERGGARPTLLGYDYVIDQGMANIGTGNRPICFGDLTEFHIREVLGINMFRFAERYMDFLQIGFMAYARYDSNLIDTAAVVTDIGVA